MPASVIPAERLAPSADARCGWVARGAGRRPIVSPPGPKAFSFFFYLMRLVAKSQGDGNGSTMNYAAQALHR